MEVLSEISKYKDLYNQYRVSCVPENVDNDMNKVSITQNTNNKRLYIFSNSID